MVLMGRSLDLGPHQILTTLLGGCLRHSALCDGGDLTREDGLGTAASSRPQLVKDKIPNAAGINNYVMTD